MPTTSTTAPTRFTFAISSYDHVEELVTGRVPVAGAEPLFIRLPIPEMFRRFVVSQDWDVSEMSFVQYGTTRLNDDDRLVGIPVFPSRLYRQSSIFVRSDRISSPEDLIGSRVGIPAWANSAGVWARGLLEDMHGIRPADITWYQGGIERPGRPEAVPARHLADDVEIVRVADRGMEEMLWSGDLEGIILPAPPPSLETSVRSGGLVRLLYEDMETAERRYREQTRCLPIMHVVAVTRAFYEREPDILLRLYDALEAARTRYLDRLHDTAVSRVPLPWVDDHLADLDAVLGPQTWPYGIEPNRPTLETYLRYVRSQGLVGRDADPAELFPEWLAATAGR